ncbi:MAG: endonuclease NucS domain-containing protein [Candidatus Atabeyarchaeum deiterrae]
MTEKNVYKYSLYLKNSGAGGSSAGSAKDLLEKLKVKEETVTTIVVDALRLTDVDQEKIATDIRSIPPQVRGRVVSGGGMILALSGTKNLNFNNTPILLVRDNLDRPVAVFPHALEEKVESVEDHLSNALSLGVETALHQKRMPTEELLTQLISMEPSMVEEGARVLGCEYPTPTGRIDLLLVDKNGTPIVVEVEVTATEQAVGQVCKLAEGYMELTRKKARKAIICLKTKGMLRQSCKSAKVELYQLRTERLP